MTIEFEKQVVKAKFRNPNLNFEVDEQLIEYRRDPLLGRGCVIPHGLKQKASFYYGTPDRRALKKTIEDSRATCFFCPEKLEKSTTKFLEEISKEGKIRVNKAIAFPNIFPYYPYCAVITTDEHFIPFDEMPPEFYGDMIKAGIKVIKKSYEFDKTAKYPFIGANFLQPAGSSVAHPHIHALAGPEELFRIRLLREKSREFRNSTGKNYWDQLIVKEKTLGERYIAQTGNIYWYSPFAPLGNNEVRAILKGKSNFLDVSDEDITHLGKGIANILHYYHKKKIFSFNFFLYSGPLGDPKDAELFYIGWQIISRPAIRQFWVNDIYYFQVLGFDSVIFEFPETIAHDVRTYFTKS
ncbi:MAG: HIT domain-containing protein [Candidatus Helarchaeota archaeon]